ncbi:GST-like protein yncG [Raoultella planticola]|uniref:GST-like protein yncG n=1 Tax=Raoultella planticola TaxID=575 RepID=A0A8G1ZZ72_RAOPL|nr:glutathione S-transferase family protein [Raoultella planticola]SAP83855.1 GST-like protein yncG [Raoultella planticola]
MMTVYGVPGWGSAISELMLTLANIPYHFVNVAGFDQPGPQRDSLMQINPLCQVPTLRLDDGSVMTESAAIALMILDSRPDLAPAPGTPQRQQFQRLLIWLVANVYPTFTYADYPQRWTADAPEQLRENCIRYRQSLYLWLEQQLTAAPYALGADMSLLDCYIAAMCSWGPRRAWFMAYTPKFVAVADKVYQRPELQQVLRDNELI